MIIAVTGHRPNKLGGYDNEDAQRAIRRHMRDFLRTVPQEELTLTSGGALGVDQLWMQVGLHLHLPVIAALPFEGYDAKWPVASRQEYKRLLDRCQLVKYVCEPGYAASKLQRRNEWMVDNCDALVAYWNGTPGGTKNCIDYAVKHKKTIYGFNTDQILGAL